MYIPKKFEQENTDELKQLIHDYPFATLITYSAQGLGATHLPFVLDEQSDRLILQGHIAKVNDLWETVDDNAEVLLVFNGPNCYVSPNYYPTKKETEKEVPTWNYLVVHVTGLISFIHDDLWKMAMLNQLTAEHEVNQVTPWSITDAPEAYTQKLLSAIVGIEVDVTTIKGQWKISQNQSDKNKQGVIEGLSQQDDEGAQKIAELIKPYL